MRFMIADFGGRQAFAGLAVLLLTYAWFGNEVVALTTAILAASCIGKGKGGRSVALGGSSSIVGLSPSAPKTGTLRQKLKKPNKRSIEGFFPLMKENSTALEYVLLAKRYG